MLVMLLPFSHAVNAPHWPAVTVHTSILLSTCSCCSSSTTICCSLLAWLTSTLYLHIGSLSHAANTRLKFNSHASTRILVAWFVDLFFCWDSHLADLFLEDVNKPLTDSFVHQNILKIVNSTGHLVLQVLVLERVQSEREAGDFRFSVDHLGNSINNFVLHNTGINIHTLIWRNWAPPISPSVDILWCSELASCKLTSDWWLNSLA